MNVDWSKAPEGFPIWVEDLNRDQNFDQSGWHVDRGDRYEDQSGSYWLKSDDDSFRVHERHATPQWNGEGLPPVGAVCEACGSGMGNWFKCTVLIHHPIEYGVAGVHDSIGDSLLWTDTFRQLRTPEQIAAEEREKAIHQAICDVEEKAARWNTHVDCTAAIKATIEIMIDAGYRKQEQPE